MTSLHQSSMRTSVLTCGHPSRRTRKRVLLRMRSEIVETNEAARTAALILRSMRAQHACVSKDGPTQKVMYANAVIYCGKSDPGLRPPRKRADPSIPLRGRHLCNDVIYAESSQVDSLLPGRPKLAPGTTVSSMDSTTSMESMREATSMQSSSGPPPTAGPRAQALRRSIRATGVSSMRTEAGEHDPFGASASWPRNGRCHQWTARHLWNLCGRHVIYANGPRTPFPTGPLNQSCRRPDNR